MKSHFILSHQRMLACQQCLAYRSSQERLQDLGIDEYVGRDIMSLFSTLTSLALSGLLYYGAFSRLTHGQYTPQFYAHQIARQPDDGSPTATIVPCVDILLATLMLRGSRGVKRWTAVMAGVVQALGIVVALSRGLDVKPDLLVWATCIAAAVEA
jgi:hypothetical protein